MKEKKQNEEMQSRREFFKEAAKKGTANPWCYSTGKFSNYRAGSVEDKTDWL